MKATLTNDQRISWLENLCERHPEVLKEELYELVSVQKYFLGDAIDILYEEWELGE